MTTKGFHGDFWGLSRQLKDFITAAVWDSDGYAGSENQITLPTFHSQIK